MRVGVRVCLITAVAASAMGCDAGTAANSRQSVTVKLPPPRPYKPAPGFTLATDLPEPVAAQQPPRS